MASEKLTNKQRLANGTKQEITDILKKVFLDNPCRQFVDIKKWLDSTDVAPTYAGKPIKCILGTKGHQHEYDAVLISERKFYNVTYCQVVIPSENNFFEIPKEAIKK